MLTLPLTETLKKNRKLYCTEQAQRAIVDLKSRLAYRNILMPPVYHQRLLLTADVTQSCVHGRIYRWGMDRTGSAPQMNFELLKHLELLENGAKFNANPSLRNFTPRNFVLASPLHVCLR